MTKSQANDPRSPILTGLRTIYGADEGAARAAAEALFAPDAQIDVFHPVNALQGGAAFWDAMIRPLRAAIPGVMRRDEIFIGGDTVMGQGYWVASFGHYVGLMQGPFCGVQPSGKLVFLRYGEYYRVENGKVVEAKILHDLIDLIRQTGACPPLQDLGTEMLFPGPATHDGVLPDAAERSVASGALVWKMLADLSHYDPETFQSPGQTGPDGAWGDDMLWYGPGGIGSTHTYQGFEDHHRVAYLRAFPDRKGGNHFCRISDGDYVASGGWPSQTLTHRDTYLGVPATNLALTLRVMDLWRVEGGKIRENWVLLDFVELLSNMGRDIIAEHQALAKG
ncbi:MAG: ester cyclase [Pseudomonadota bacterium]